MLTINLVEPEIKESQEDDIHEADANNKNEGPLEDAQSEECSEQSEDESGVAKQIPTEEQVISVNKSSHAQESSPSQDSKPQPKRSRIFKKKTLNTINEVEGEDESDNFGEEHSYHSFDAEESKEDQEVSVSKPEQQYGEFHITDDIYTK